MKLTDANKSELKSNRQPGVDYFIMKKVAVGLK